MEEDTAKLRIGFDLLRMDLVDGVELGNRAAMEELGRKRKEERGGMEWAGRRGAGGDGHGPPSPPEATTACGMGTGGGGGMAPVPPGTVEKQTNS